MTVEKSNPGACEVVFAPLRQLMTGHPGPYPLMEIWRLRVWLKQCLGTISLGITQQVCN